MFDFKLARRQAPIPRSELEVNARLHFSANTSSYKSKKIPQVFVQSVKLCYSKNMCEKRTRKIKKGSQVARVREARRLQRLNWLASPASSDDSNSTPCPTAIEAHKTAQNRVILELAWKTVALMHKNRLIQQKIIALQKETSEFVASVMTNGENRRRYMEQIELYTRAQQAQARQICEISTNIPLKLEPDD